MTFLTRAIIAEMGLVITIIKDGHLSLSGVTCIYLDTHSRIKPIDRDLMQSPNTA